MNIQAFIAAAKARKTNGSTENDSNLVIVDDGQFRWVGDAHEIDAWLDEHGYTRRDARSMTPEQYQALCDDTTCLSDQIGLVGSGDVIELCNTLRDEHGVDVIHVG